MEGSVIACLSACGAQIFFTDTHVLMLSVSIDKYVFSGTAGAGRAGTNDTSNHGDKHQRVTACQTHSAHTLLQHARTHELNDLGFPLTKKKKGLQSSALQPIYQSSERKGLLSNAKHKWKNRSSTIPIILSTNSVKNQKKHCRGIAHVSHKHMHNIFVLPLFHDDRKVLYAT